MAEKTRKKQKEVPAATLRGTYTTYYNSKPRNYLPRLGPVVDFTIENMITIECGAWCSGLRITCKPGHNVHVETKPDGRTVVFVAHRR